MRIGIGILVAAVVLAALCMSVRRLTRGGGCCGGREAQVRRLRPSRGRYRYRASLRVEGMVCQNCARRVENALNALPGVSARVSLPDHLAAVRTVDPPDLDALTAAVRRAGYAALDARVVS